MTLSMTLSVITNLSDCLRVCVFARIELNLKIICLGFELNVLVLQTPWRLNKTMCSLRLREECINFGITSLVNWKYGYRLAVNITQVAAARTDVGQQCRLHFTPGRFHSLHEYFIAFFLYSEPSFICVFNLTLVYKLYSCFSLSTKSCSTLENPQPIFALA